jgi:protein-tyrosine-phosphatase
VTFLTQFEKMVNKKKILFVCTGNSCRSQIAHGLMNEFAGEKFEIDLNEIYV